MNESAFTYVTVWMKLFLLFLKSEATTVYFILWDVIDTLCRLTTAGINVWKL